MAKLASTTYGDALFALALEENKLDEFLEEAMAVNQALVDNQELSKLLNHPKIVKDEKVRMVESIFTGMMSMDMVGFLTIIVSKGRHNEIKAILEYFIKKVKKHKKIGTAYVSSAIELDDVQKASVQQRLLEVTQYVSFEIYYKVDKRLIGGMVIRIDDRVVDSSIKTQIENMSKSLMKIQLS